MNQHEYEENLASLGFEKLGSGLYSNIYAIPNTDKVLKVGSMDEWPSYIKWATDNGHAGKLAPKVYSLKFHSEFYVAIMERLVCTISEIKYEARGNTSSQARVYASWHADDCEATDVKTYIKELQANQLNGDLHDQNWMVRSDGQVVIIDPCSGRFSSARFRIKNGACL